MLDLFGFVPIIYIVALVIFDVSIISRDEKCNHLAVLIKSWPALCMFVFLGILVFIGTSSINTLLEKAYSRDFTIVISLFSLTSGYWLTKKLLHVVYKPVLKGISLPKVEITMHYISYSLGATFFYFCIWLLIAILWRIVYGKFPL